MKGETIVALRDQAEISDRALVSAVMAGDESAFRALYRRHTPRVRMLARRLLGAHDSGIDDVVQEAWIRACRSLPTFEWRSSLSTWLCGIMIRCALESRRSRGRHDRRIQVAYDLYTYPSEDPYSRETRVDLERALEQLSDRQRFVVVLHDVEGYTHQEIAQRLGIPEGTSKSHLFRGRVALRSILGLENGK